MSSLKKAIKQFLPYGLVKKYEPFSGQVIGNTTRITPEIFNANGEKMHVFYLKDRTCSHSPYTFSSNYYAKTRYILWDRYNMALPIHFYSHLDIFEGVYGKCEKKFALLIESEAIVADHYKRAFENTAVISDYNGLFTSSDRLLNKYSNALFMPGSSVWFGGDIGGGFLDDKAYEKKSKNISLVSSDKIMCELHKYRKEMALYYEKSDKVDTFGTFNGGKNIRIAESLTDYRYSFAIENHISDYYFTEKLLNCFASMTIPIYIGARKISEFFNIDGIIQIKPCGFSELDKIINGFGKELYEERIEAVKDNFKRVMEYLCYEDYLYEHYAYLFN